MKTKNKPTLKLALILAVILFIASFLNMSAFADTPDTITSPNEQAEEGRSQTPPQGAPALKTEGKSPMSGNLVYDYTININDTITTVAGVYEWDGLTDKLTIKDPDKSYLITGTGIAVKKQIVVDVGSTGTVNITIKDVKIEFSTATADNNKAAFFINSGKVLLNLEGTNTLTSGRDRGGVEVGAGKEITITGSGSLIATSGYGAGIGGGYGGDGGNITINGGDITATSYFGAGIGGGGDGGGIGGGSGGNITINGGDITATSSEGAGIGGGAGDGGNITISGGKITATSGSGAGIGGGGGDGGNITISGGKITATSTNGAGIGGRRGGGDVIISGEAEVTAKSENRKDVGGVYNNGDGGSLLVEGDAILIFETGNANTSGTAPTPTIEGNGLIINGLNNTILGGEDKALGLSLLVDKPSVTLGQKATITVDISKIRDILGDPLGKVELLKNGLMVKEITGITATNNKITFDFSPTAAGDFKFTAEYVKSGAGTDFYKKSTSADLVVKVNELPALVSIITLSPSPAMVQVGKAVNLKAEITPTNAADKSITWKSSDNSIATVDTVGLVNGVSVGTTTITATANDGSGVFGTTIVTVTINPPIVYKVVQIPSAKNNYTAKVDVNFSDFIGVTINNKVLAARDFTASSGSTLVKLSQKFLDTLLAGNHTITLSFKGGTATATFTKTATDGTGSGSGSGTGAGSEIATYEPKPWISGDLSAAIKKADSNPSTGARDIISVETMFMVFSLVGAVVIGRKRKD